MLQTHEETHVTLRGRRGQVRAVMLLDSHIIGAGAFIESNLLLELQDQDSTPTSLESPRDLAEAWTAIDASRTVDAANLLSQLVVALLNVSGRRTRNCLFPERVPHFHEPEFRGPDLIFWALVDVGVDVKLSWSTLDGSLRELARHETPTEL